MGLAEMRVSKFVFQRISTKFGMGMWYPYTLEMVMSHLLVFFIQPQLMRSNRRTPPGKTYIDVWVLICHRPRAAGTPQLWDPFAQSGPLKGDNWKNGYSALSQPHMDRLSSYFTKWYSVALGKLRNCENPLRVESKMADDVQIFNIRTPVNISRTAEAIDCKFSRK